MRVQTVVLQEHTVMRLGATIGADDDVSLVGAAGSRPS
jgi:hypothetical protein